MLSIFAVLLINDATNSPSDPLPDEELLVREGDGPCRDEEPSQARYCNPPPCIVKKNVKCIHATGGVIPLSGISGGVEK